MTSILILSCLLGPSLALFCDADLYDVWRAYKLEYGRQYGDPADNIPSSCYALSATGPLKGQLFRAAGTLVSLSQKNIVDCSFTQGNVGCDGGDINNAFQYIMENGGIDTEKSYPYMQSVGKCDNKKHNGTNMTACRYILSGSERDLEIAVALEGPVSVAIDASQKGFQSYKSGIYDDPSCTHRLNHSVLVVGYVTDGGKDYWLVKNMYSWGFF